MANEFKHASVGTELTQAEFEAIGGHVFDGQAAGDILYAADGSQLVRLPKGTDGNVLYLASGLPAWGVVPTHVSRHQFGGADEINDKDILLARHQVYIYADTITLNGYSEYKSGSGSTTIGVIPYVTLTTGATINSEACRRTAQQITLDYESPFRRARWAVLIDWRTAAVSNSIGWFGFTENQDPNNTEKHAAFKFLDGNIWCSCADGATQTIEDSGVDYEIYGKYHLFIKFMESNIKYYIDGTLRKTFTTNRPPPGGNTFRSTLYLKTTDAVSKFLWFYPVQMLLGDE